MKVVLLSPDPGLASTQVGGGGTHLRGTLDALRAGGADVVPVIAGDDAQPSSGAGRRLRAYVPRRARLVRSDLRRRGGQRAMVDRLGGIVDAVRPDVVYERNAYLLDPGTTLRRHRSFAHVLETDLEAAEFWAASWGTASLRYARRVERRKFERADAVVVMSEAAARRVAHKRVFVKGLGVDDRFFAVERRPIERPLVVFSGTFQPYHGVDLLLAAARSLPDVGVRLVGGGPRRAGYEALAPSNAEFVGKVAPDAVPIVLAEASVGVIPDSSSYMYPIKLLEYAAVGLPVIAPAYDAYAEFEGDLFTFEPGSASSLAAAVESVLRDPAGADARARSLRARVVSDFTWDAVGRRLVAFLEELVHG